MSESTLQKSVSHPPYHLRTNKAIDRLLFVDIIRAFATVFDMHESKYRYIGFGGPYLEDFKLLANAFPGMNLISLETDKETFKRQKFHKCTKKLELINDSFTQYLNYTEIFDKYPAIVWLDYTDFNISRFREMETLGSKLISPSIVRVTLGASKKEGNEVEKFSRKYTDYLPNGFDTSDLRSREGMRLVICNMICRALRKNLQSKHFIPLHQVGYEDGLPMVSVTGVICEKVTDKQILSMQKVCSHITTDADIVEEINVPFLTLKERARLEKFLPCFREDGTKVAKELGYLVAKKLEDHLVKCKQYEKYYRYYPYFSKIVP